VAAVLLGLLVLIGAAVVQEKFTWWQLPSHDALNDMGVIASICTDGSASHCRPNRPSSLQDPHQRNSTSSKKRLAPSVTIPTFSGVLTEDEETVAAPV
jgi:hypothetical protein